VFPQASVARQLRVKVFEQLLPEVVSPRLVGVTGPSQLSDAVGAVKLGVNVAGQPSTVELLPCPPIVTTHVQLCVGFSATKMPAHGLLALIVADPLPVEPVPALKFHAPPIPCVMVVYDWVRAPGDVAVVNELRTESLRVAANIRTAALAVTVVIEVTPEILVPLPVV